MGHGGGGGGVLAREGGERGREEEKEEDLSYNHLPTGNLSGNLSTGVVFAPEVVKEEKKS